MRGLRVALALGVSALALTMAAPVWAQGGKAPAQDDKDSYAIETVVVTAQRREEAANDIGMPIQAF
ncbi:MAG: hypothetical protein QM608_19450, partial [Caulobacter sp.]